MEKILINRATRVKGDEHYEFRVGIDFHGLHFVLRLLARANLYSLTIYSKSEYKLIKDFGETIELTKNWDDILRVKDIFVRQAKIACHLHQTMLGDSLELTTLSWNS